MFIVPPDIESLIIKVVKKSKEEAVWPYLKFYDYKPKSHTLEDQAGNHAFDDYPEIFGITEHVGRCIRAFFQVHGCRCNKEVFDCVEKIIESALNMAEG